MVNLMEVCICSPIQKLFKSLISSIKKKYGVKMYSLNLENGTFNNKTLILSISFDKNREINPFTIEKSEDQTKLLIINLDKKKESVTTNLEFAIIDQNLTVLTKKHLSLSSPINGIAKVDNTGNINILHFHNDSPRLLTMAKENDYQFNYTPIDLKLASKYKVHNLQLEAKDNKLYATGNFSNGTEIGLSHNSEATVGLFISSISEGKMDYIKEIEFDADIMENYVMSVNRKDRKDDLNKLSDGTFIVGEFSPKLIVNTAGNESVFIFEHLAIHDVEKITIDMSKDNPSATKKERYYRYTFGHILAVKLNSNGEVLFQKTIPKLYEWDSRIKPKKRNLAEENPIYSFVAGDNNDNIYCYFMDAPGNTKINEFKNIKNIESLGFKLIFDVTEAKLNITSGEVTRKNLEGEAGRLKPLIWTDERHFYDSKKREIIAFSNFRAIRKNGLIKYSFNTKN